jgi:hypothetical protein
MAEIEDDLKNFEVWLKQIQGIDPAMLDADELEACPLSAHGQKSRAYDTVSIGLLASAR